jgi:3'-phosphoadenosine 5'-phosphosulfate sulfotransferase (PAPS reductase)/FAD synthetase
MSHRTVCHFSCGAASAVATKLTLESCDDVVIYNVLVREEHEDNRRFLADCEKWFGMAVTVLQDQKYGASTHEVWGKRRFMVSGKTGMAPCSHHLKRDVLNSVAEPGDVIVLGYTKEERHRKDRLLANSPYETFAFPLIDRDLSHDDCLSIVERSGIVLPLMYRMGYRNANCIGCPKGGQNYWQKIRHDFPEQFVQIKTIQEDIGPGAYFLQFRSGPRKGERMSLANLPSGHGNLADEPSFSCSFLCEMTARELSK